MNASFLALLKDGIFLQLVLGITLGIGFGSAAGVQGLAAWMTAEIRNRLFNLFLYGVVSLLNIALAGAIFVFVKIFDNSLILWIALGVAMVTLFFSERILSRPL